jgi:pimeloyl-ACP methyl ester carboxylesterase
MAEITEHLSTALADRYRIERRLGEGGMATVYLAEDLKHDRKVALKVLRRWRVDVAWWGAHLTLLDINAALRHARGPITAPTLVIVGEQDLLTPPWIVQEVAAAIPGARLEIIRGDGASHVVPLERPDEFNRLVIEFLTGPDGVLGAGAMEAAVVAHA